MHSDVAHTWMSGKEHNILMVAKPTHFIVALMDMQSGPAESLVSIVVAGVHEMKWFRNGWCNCEKISM